MRSTFVAACLAGLIVFLGSCRLFQDFSDVELEHERCDVGVQVECPCPDGGLGYQKCTTEGVYSKCYCGEDAGG